jgi:hypothetical protein
MAIRNMLLPIATFAIAGTILFGLGAKVPLWSQQPPAFAQTMQSPLSCQDIANRLGGIPVPNGAVCDVVVVRQSPQIAGADGMNLTQFTLMNSVLEFIAAPSNATAATGNATTGSSQQVYVMGDFALLETEMNDVLAVVKDNGWTVTGIHNHMINETPKTTFMHWEARGNLDTIIDQANAAFDQTSIKG